MHCATVKSGSAHLPRKVWWFYFWSTCAKLIFSLHIKRSRELPCFSATGIFLESTTTQIPTLIDSLNIIMLPDFNFPYLAATLAIVVFQLAYFAFIVVHRLYFSPLSGFPGPKLAAATSWYEFYYQYWLNGQYVFQIEKLHKKYGTYPRSMNHVKTQRGSLLMIFRTNCSGHSRRTFHPRPRILQRAVCYRKPTAN